jgi:hypothetical protein
MPRPLPGEALTEPASPRGFHLSVSLCPSLGAHSATSGRGGGTRRRRSRRAWRGVGISYPQASPLANLCIPSSVHLHCSPLPVFLRRSRSRSPFTGPNSERDCRVHHHVRLLPCASDQGETPGVTGSASPGTLRSWIQASSHPTWARSSSCPWSAGCTSVRRGRLRGVPGLGRFGQNHSRTARSSSGSSKRSSLRFAAPRFAFLLSAWRKRRTASSRLPSADCTIPRWCATSARWGTTRR